MCKFGYLTNKSATYVHSPDLSIHNDLTDIDHMSFLLPQVYTDTGR